MFARRLALVLAAGPALAGPAAAAPTVETMAVGRSGTLLGARQVTAGAGTVGVAGRRCAVAAATPLAALLALVQVDRGAVGLHDYGHCDSSPADSALLFVNSLGGQANFGEDGWEYKVGHRSGSTGAADSSGALGNGRLLSAGQRVLWFWCVAGAGGCQRTLDISVSYPAGRLVAGGALTASVTGYDNNGRGRPVTGATVWLGATRALTGRGGRASLAVPSRAGRYVLSAARSGMAPSFPETIVVR